jgi:hypothetical protein
VVSCARTGATPVATTETMSSVVTTTRRDMTIGEETPGRDRLLHVTGL